MTRLRNSFEGGTNGAQVASGSGGTSGDAFSAAVPTLLYSNAQAAHGVMSSGAVNPTTNLAYARWAITENVVAMRGYLWLSSAPTLDLDMLTIVSAAGAVIFRINQLGFARLASVGTTLWTSTVAFPAATWTVIELFASAGTSTTTGQARARWFPMGSAVPDDINHESTLIGGVNTAGSGAAFTQVYFGKSGGNNYSGDFYQDTVAANTGIDAVDLIGPELSPAEGAFNKSAISAMTGSRH